MSGQYMKKCVWVSNEAGVKPVPLDKVDKRRAGTTRFITLPWVKVDGNTRASGISQFKVLIQFSRLRDLSTHLKRIFLAVMNFKETQLI